MGSSTGGSRFRSQNAYAGVAQLAASSGAVVRHLVTTVGLGLQAFAAVLEAAVTPRREPVRFDLELP